MAWDGVLVRFGEIGIKSPPVRRRMEQRLRSQLESAMLRRGVEGGVERRDSRLWMQGPDPDALLDVATHTFGVVTASRVRLCDANIEALCKAAVDLAAAVPGWSSFAIRARRSGHHDFSSQDIQVQVGSAVVLAGRAAGRDPQVDLSTPDLMIYIEVRGGTGFLHTELAPGPGGLPMGSQGKVVALVSDAASCVAAWLMMRRGCEVVAVHAGDTGSPPIENLERLMAWGLPPMLELLPVCTGTVSKQVLLDAAEHLAQETGSVAVVTGETLVSDLVVPTGPVPVLRPVCGLDLEEYARWAARIGLVDDAPDSILDAEARETVETLMSMRQQVDL